jgi:prevent-host-death family protein
MKAKPTVRYTSGGARPVVMRDALPARRAAGAPSAVSVRTAKANLSALLDQVAGGAEVLITSDGRPKARLVPIAPGRLPRGFPGSADHLATMPAWRGGPDSTEIISGGRDDRG